MCGSESIRQATQGPAEGATIKLNEAQRRAPRHCGVAFPWWTFWLLWPLFYLVKGAAHLAAPLLSWLSQPLILTVTPLPLLLIGAGLALLLVAATRRHRGG